MATQHASPFGALLLEYRTSAGMTQEQLAARARLSPGAIAALERGKRRTPRRITVELLAGALGLEDSARERLVLAARKSAVPADVRGAPGAESDAVPLRRAGRGTASLVDESTPLVGRARELDTIVGLLVQDGVRLLTLTGPAGVGKTRLAVAAAARIGECTSRFAGGVDVVDLTPVRDPAQVLGAVARALSLLEVGGKSLLERLTGILTEPHLLVLDNFEQLLPAASQLSTLLAASPKLALLVTSRTPLQLRLEHVLRISPLPVPDPAMPLPPMEELATIPSIALFLQRARERGADVTLTEQQAPLVAQLAAQLDGLPLALELAAARTATLSLPAIVHRLGNRLHLFRWEAADVPLRQQSLEAAIGWSYELLDEAEQRIFRCLGAFAGLVPLGAVTHVMTEVARNTGDSREGDAQRMLDGLLSLAKQSLILPAQCPDLGWGDGDSGNVGRSAEDPEPTYTMLETVRAYAEEQLARSGELDAARQAHAHYFLDLAERADAHLRGRDQRAWWPLLEREHNNLQVALRWLLDQEDAPFRHAGLRLCVALGYFWRMRGYHREGTTWLHEALSKAQGADPAVRTIALIKSGQLHMLLGETTQARARFEEGLARAKLHDSSAAIAEALMHLGVCPLFAGEAADVRLLTEALDRAREAGDAHLAANALYFLGAAQAQGDREQAAAHYAESLQILMSTGDIRPIATVECGFASLLGQHGDLLEAVSHIRYGLAATAAVRDLWTLSQGAYVALTVLRDVADPLQCVRLTGAVDALRQRTGAGGGAWEHTQADARARGSQRPITRQEWEAAYREGRSLHAGKVVTLMQRLLDEVSVQITRADRADMAPEPLPTATATGPHYLLSPREREILRLVAQGHSSKTIARELFLSPNTVNHHLAAIFDKLGVDTRPQAVAVAAQRGLL